jgi:hypothetical protein
MDDQFHTTFSFGSLAYMCGWIFLAGAIYILAVQLRSVLLRLSALALLVCAFSAVVSQVMPIHFGLVGADGQAHFPVWPPHWVSWLALMGAPSALFFSGVSACIFVLLRSHQSRLTIRSTRSSGRSGEDPAPGTTR